jgi:hypothetical protein
MPRVAKQTFATMNANFAHVKVGDTVYVSTSMTTDPTRYTIEQGSHPTRFKLVGARGAKRELVLASAEKSVWLCNGTRARRVVQAWVERLKIVSKADIGLIVLPGLIGQSEAQTVAVESTEVEQLRSALYDSNAELVAARAEVKRLGGYIEALREVAPDAWDLTGNDLDDSATLAVCVGRLIHDLRVLNQAHAELGRKLDAAETERDGMSRALCQLLNIAAGVEPGTQPLPSNTSPESVVVTVSAAMLRLACGSPPGRMPGFYRDAIAGALPSSMQWMGTRIDPLGPG